MSIPRYYPPPPAPGYSELVPTRGTVNERESGYFKSNSGISKHQQKYCRCTLHVMAKNSDECNRSHKWGSGHCYNPYSVCSKTVGRDEKECGIYFNWHGIPEDEVKAFASNKGLSTSGSKEDVISRIENYINKK